MSRRVWILKSLIFVGLFSASEVCAQTKLELTFPPNETVRQQMVQSTKIDVTPPGQKEVFTTQIDQSWLLESKAGKTQDDGSAEVRQHFSQIAMTIQLPAPIGKRVSVDTAQPKASDDKTEQAIQVAVSKVLNLDWMITFQKNGAVRKVALSDELSDLLVDNPQVGPLMDTFTEKGLRKLSEQSTVILPLDPVAKGDQWEQSVTMEFPDGKLITERTCHFDGTGDDGLAKISVKLEASFQPAKSTRNPMELTSNTGAGEVYFDAKAGRVVRSKFQQTLVLKVGAGEQQGTQKIQLTTVLHPVDDKKSSESSEK